MTITKLKAHLRACYCNTEGHRFQAYLIAMELFRRISDATVNQKLRAYRNSTARPNKSAQSFPPRPKLPHVFCVACTRYESFLMQCNLTLPYLTLQWCGARNLSPLAAKTYD